MGLKFQAQGWVWSRRRPGWVLGVFGGFRFDGSGALVQRRMGHSAAGGGWASGTCRNRTLDLGWCLTLA